MTESACDRCVAKMDKMYNKLFEGNGQPSLMTQVKLNAMSIKAFWVLYILVIGAIVAVVFK